MNHLVTTFTLVIGTSLIGSLCIPQNSFAATLECGSLTPATLAGMSVRTSAESALVDKETMNNLVWKFGDLSNQPQELKDAFAAFYNGSMSLSLFEKVSAEFPNLHGSASILFLKNQLRTLHLKNGFSADDQEIIRETFKQFRKSFAFRSETEDYYIVEMPLKDPSDAKFLGTLGTTATTAPLLFNSNEGLPTKRFFQLPSSVLNDMSDRVFRLTQKDVDPRYGIINTAGSRKNMTYEALKSLVTYDGSSPLTLVYSVSKKSLAAIRANEPKLDQPDLAGIVEVNGLELLRSVRGKYSRLPETEDSIAFQITIKSVDETQAINDLFKLAFDSRFSLPE